MRRCYAHVPAAENPLRRKTPKSPWSRRILFPAPSGHFRIVLFLIGLIGCFRWVFVPSVYWLGSFFVSSSGFRFPMFSFFDYRGLLRSVRSSLMMAFRSVVFVFCPYWRAYAFRFPGLCVRSFGRLRFSSSVFPLGGFMSFVRLQVSFIDSFVSFSWLCFSSSFPVLHSFSLFRLFLRLRFPPPVLFLRVACVFLSVSWVSIAVRPFRLRSPIPPLRITSS